MSEVQDVVIVGVLSQVTGKASLTHKIVRPLWMSCRPDVDRQRLPVNFHFSCTLEEVTLISN